MSEYWKSLPRKYCDICKCWFADNKASIEFHERGKRHQENAAKRIQDIQKRGIKDFKKQKKLEEDMEKIEKAALAAYQKDLQNLQNNLEAASNPSLDNCIKDLPYNVPEISKINKTPSEPKRTKESKNKAKKPKLSVNPKTISVEKKISEESSNGFEVKPEPVPETRKWYEAKTDEGYKYYWHVETAESCWEPPDEGFVSLEEQEVINSQSNTENTAPEIKEEPREDEVEEHNLENVEEPLLSFGPQPKVDPYGQWVTVVKKEPVEIDLQLPKPSEDLIEVVIPVVKDKPKLKFKEKVVGQLEDMDPSEGVTFKKRKFAGSSAKRNARQRNLDDD